VGDGRASVRQLTDNNGRITLARTYDEFGLILSQAGSGTAVFGFAGSQSGAAGLLYINGRYYDPATGRFLSPNNNFDPLRPGTLNGYLASLLMANPGTFFFGPLLVLNWRRRKRRKGKYDRLLLLVVGIGLGITLVSCRQEQEETSTPIQPAPIQPIPTPEPTEPEPPTGTPSPSPSPSPPPTNTPITPTPTITPCPTPTDTPPLTSTPIPTLPSDIDWLPGFPNRDGRWWITHYYVPIESDPYYASEREIQARGLPADKRYRERFINDVYRQGTGLAKNGDYISVDYIRSQPGMGYLKLGHGKPNAVPWKTVASLDPRLPRGITEIVIYRYRSMGVFRVEDEGGELEANQVDVFVGEMFKANVDALGAFYSDVGIVR